jgi:hypothetical protein
LDHGVYDLEVVLTAKITGTSKTLSSNILRHKVIKIVNSDNPLFAYLLPSRIE